MNLITWLNNRFSLFFAEQPNTADVPVAQRHRAKEY